MQRYEIDLNASFRSAHAFAPAVGLAASGRVDLAGLLTGRFALDEAPAALRAPGADPRHLKVVVRSGVTSTAPPGPDPSEDAWTPPEAHRTRPQ